MDVYLTFFKRCVLNWNRGNASKSQNQKKIIFREILFKILLKRTWTKVFDTAWCISQKNLLQKSRDKFEIPPSPLSQCWTHIWICFNIEIGGKGLYYIELKCYICCICACLNNLCLWLYYRRGIDPVTSNTVVRLLYHCAITSFIFYGIVLFSYNIYPVFSSIFW